MGLQPLHTPARGYTYKVAGNKIKAKQGPKQWCHDQRSRSEERSPNTPLTQAEAYPTLSGKKSPMVSRSVSALLPFAGLKGIGDFGKQGGQCIQEPHSTESGGMPRWKGPRNAPSRFQPMSSTRHLTLPNETLRTVSPGEPLSNRAPPNTHETPDSVLPGTSTLASQH